MEVVQLVLALQQVPCIGPYVVWALPLILCGAVLDAFVPQPTAGSSWTPLRKVISWCGLNILYAKNAIPAGAPKAVVALADAADAVLAAEKTKAAGAGVVTTVTIVPVVGATPEVKS